MWETNTKLDANGVSSAVSSGSLFAVADLPVTLYLEGVSGSADFNDTELKAEHATYGCKDVVKVTVFEVTLTGLFGYGDQQSDNEKKHSSFQHSSDKNGKISWDDGNADGVVGPNDPNCEYFHNCIELQGTVKPSGVNAQVEFDVKREKWGKSWRMLDGGTWGLIPGCDWTPWEGDDGSDIEEDLTPSAGDHIYGLDGPGFNTRERGLFHDYLCCIIDFREYVKVRIDGTWYDCSGFYKWHSKCYTKPKAGTTFMTRDSIGLQILGSGWITVPNSP